LQFHTSSYAVVRLKGELFERSEFSPSAQRNLEPVGIVQSVNCILPRLVRVSPIIAKIYFENF